MTKFYFNTHCFMLGVGWNLFYRGIYVLVLKGLECFFPLNLHMDGFTEQEKRTWELPALGSKSENKNG